MLVAWRACVLAGSIAVVPLVAAAQIPSSEQPGREAERFLEPSAPRAVSGGPVISLPGATAPDGAAAIQIHILHVSIVGATVYDEVDFAPLLAELVGRTVALSAVYDLARQVTAKYGDAGYVLSRAVVPPQNLDQSGAEITIQVIEGFVDRVEWPTGLARYRDFFTDYAAKITAERPANIKTIMRYLLLAGDLPGIDVSSRFQASADISGASTLVVDVAEKPFDVSAQIDNRGTEARGPWEFNLGATANNLLGQHEALTATYAGAAEIDELQHVAVAFRKVLTAEGLMLFANGSYSWGKPGTDILTALDFASRSLSADIGFSFPIVRSRERNLTISSEFFLSDNYGDILSSPNSEDRLRGFRLKGDFDWAGNSGSVTQVGAVLSQGVPDVGGTANGNPLASRANGRVDFTKIEGTINRVRPLRNGFSLRAAAKGQYAFTPLLASEECGYGGREFGRGFDPSELTGDSCWSVLGELRFDLPTTSLLASSQLYVFADFGSVYRLAPTTGTPTSQDGASAGLGLRMGWHDHFTADISMVKPLFGRTDHGWRYFFTARATY